MNAQSQTLIAVLCILISGCASMRTSSEPTFNQKVLESQKQKIAQGEDVYASKPSPATSDPMESSLWAKAAGSPYLIRNQKAQYVGDLLTVLVAETATATTAAKTDAKRDGSQELTGDLKWGMQESKQRGLLSSTMGNKNDFKGEGTTDRSGSIETTVQAVVEHVLPNGTLFVRGRKVITINHEDQELLISGFVRPDDIRINNTVQSSLLADAEIRYVGQGVISDKQHTGWGTRILDAIWPF